MRAGLVLLALLAIGVRVVGIGWGIPESSEPGTAIDYLSSYHLDEDNFVWGALQIHPAAGDFDPDDYHWGTLQFYLLYATFAAESRLGLIPAAWHDSFTDRNPTVLRRLYVSGRLVSVVAGVVGTFVVAALGAAICGWRGGLFAGVAYAIAPMAVMEAHYLTNDIVASVLAAASVLCVVVAVQRLRIEWLVAAGILLGLGVSDKYSAMFSVPALLVGEWLFVRAARRPIAAVLLPSAALALGFFLGEPYAVIAPRKITAGAATLIAGNAATFPPQLRATWQMLRWSAVQTAAFALTWPLALLALSGVGVLVWRRHERTPLIVLAAIAGQVVGLTLNRIPMLRYTQPLLPLLAVAAAAAWSAVPRPALRWSAAAIALTAAFVVTLGQLSILTRPHPANELAGWLRTHLKPGQTLARAWGEYTPLNSREYTLVRIEPWKPDVPDGARPDVIVLDDMLFNPPTPRFDRVLSEEYREVIRFEQRPRIGFVSWNEGTTPHDWKYSHPRFIVYERRRSSP